MARLISGKRLSSMEANSLSIETDAAPMHHLLIAVIEGELTRAELAQVIEAKLLQLPRFTQNVLTHRFRLRQPSWKPDPLFHVNRHLFEVQLAPPGTDDEFCALVTKIFARVLDRSKPLWEMHLVHGLSGERSAVIVKMHQSISGAEAVLKLLTAKDLLLVIETQAIRDSLRLREYLEQSFARARDAGGVAKSRTFRERLQQAPESNRYELLCDYVRREVATVLRWEGEQPPDLQQGFFDLGMDSLSTLALKDRLQKSFETQLPYTLIFETPNIEALTTYLATQVLGWDDPHGQQPRGGRYAYGNSARAAGEDSRLI